MSKKLVSPMLYLCHKFDDGSIRSGHRILCYEHLEKMCDIYDRSGVFLESPADGPLMLSSADEFLLHFAALHAMDPDRYPLTSFRFHMMWHIAFFSRFLSPRATVCYVFEDFIGKVKVMGTSCTIGTPMHLVTNKIFENWVRALELQLHKP